MNGIDKIIIFAIFVLCYALALSRKVKIAYASLGAAGLLFVLGYLTLGEAVFKAIKWDVMGGIFT
jgi:Na+/H+ antiporter NhaD/arsenite permease-like protein